MDLANADAILIMGSNFAEAHPVGFRFVMRARERGAEIIHVDPRFTRTSACSTLHLPIRAGSDLAVLGGLIRNVLHSERWQTDPFFREYLLHYTNAADLIREEFRDVAELGGLFSGWQEEAQAYDTASWQPRREQQPGSGEGAGGAGGARDSGGAAGPERGIRDQTPRSDTSTSAESDIGPPARDATLTDPSCVLQLLRRHFEPYTPERVEAVCGVPRARFEAVAEALLGNSGRERTSAIAYAVGWTQHTTGPQLIASAAILQLLLGNIGRPGGGIQALRGHATIQGSTDIPTLYDLLPGYLHMPTHLPVDETLESFVRGHQGEGGAWAHTREFVVSLLRAYFGEAASAENEFGYQLLPRITGDHSHMPTFVEMHAGQVEGLVLLGQNPAVGGQNAGFQREAMARLKWLVVRDLFPIESATFWRDSPEVRGGKLSPESIATEVFLLPAASVAEKDGSFTNTQRLIQWHTKAVEAPGDARSDAWFIYHLGRRLRERYATSSEPRDRPLQALTWEYPTTGPHEEPEIDAVLREINGYTWSPSPAERRPLQSYQELAADGSTACGCWIYCGVHPGENRAASREKGDGYIAPRWAWSWPNNVRMLYNRCSADPAGRPWSERKRYLWWDEDRGIWTGLGDYPDYPIDKRPDDPGDRSRRGVERFAGSAPFILKPEGKAWLFFPSGMKDGPLPTHYEPWETPVHNLFYRGRERNPMTTYWDIDGNRYHGIANPDYPYVLTTFRLTEHHTAGGMTRWSSHLAELQPAAFVEISPELAAEKGIANGDWVTVVTMRAEAEARALVTRRMTPLQVAGRLIHQIGFPWHYGYEGLVRGAAANDLVPLVGEPNVTIHEGKVLTCDLRPGRANSGMS
jgi:formate dehydrogenase major subunit